jgi:hypothetical protein
MLKDGHVLDTSLLNSEGMEDEFSTGITTIPTQQMPHSRRASPEQALVNKTPSSHTVDSVIDMSHSSPHARTHLPIQAVGSDVSDSALDGTRPRVITFQDLYDDDVITIVQDSWAGFQCNQNRPDLPNLQTISMHLKGLAEMLHSQDMWDCWPVPVVDMLKPISSSHITCRPVSSQARDKMSSMFQSMLQTTFHFHGLSRSPIVRPDSSETS